MKNTKNMDELKGLLIDELKKINWHTNPYKGLMKQVGLEYGYPEKTASQGVRFAIFRNKNIDMATRLIEKIKIEKSKILTNVSNLKQIMGENNE